MKAVIMGCGRVGSKLASLLDADGHDVTIIDINDYSFRRLSSDFKGKALLGNGTEEDSLKRAGIESADAFIAVTQGDNRNAMAAQICKHTFNVRRVICRFYDPLRQELYSTLGLESFSPTTIISQMLRDKLES